MAMDLSLAHASFCLPPRGKSTPESRHSACEGACEADGVQGVSQASVLQKWPLSGHLALSEGVKAKPRKHHFDQCLRGYEGWWALLDSNQ